MYKFILFIYFFKKCLSIDIFEVDISFSESSEKSFKNLDMKSKKNKLRNSLKNVLLHEIKEQNNKSKENKIKNNKLYEMKVQYNKIQDNKVQKYTNEMKKIKSNINLLTILKNNIKILNELKVNKNLFIIKNIAIYKDSKTNEIVDFWNFLKFNKKNEKYIDNTGFFEGILKNDYNDILKTSKLSKIGLWLENSVTIEEDNENLYKIKKLITEIAKHKKLAIDSDELNKKNISLIDELIFFNKYPLKGDDILTVCVCSDNNCENNCEEIRKIYRRDFL